MPSSDEDLVLSYVEGDKDSLRYLIDRYTPSLYNFAIRFMEYPDATDTVQNTFIKVWKNINSFDSSKASFKTWIFKIHRNTITDHLRKRKIIVFSDLDKEDEPFEDEIPDESISQEENLINIDDKNHLDSLINKLSDSDKAILTLYYQEEMTFEEIGQVLKIPTNTAKSKHRRAILKLRGLLS